jgi:hypothetical protein
MSMIAYRKGMIDKLKESFPHSRARARSRARRSGLTSALAVDAAQAPITSASAPSPWAGGASRSVRAASWAAVRIRPCVRPRCEHRQRVYFFDRHRGG